MRGLAAARTLVAGAILALVIAACEDVDDVSFFVQVGGDFDEDLDDDDDFDGGGLVIVIVDDDDDHDDDDDPAHRIVNRQDVRAITGSVSPMISVPRGAARLRIDVALEDANGVRLGGGRLHVPAPAGSGASLHVRLGGDPSAGCGGCSARWAFPIARRGAAAQSLFVAWNPGGDAGRPLF